MCVTRNGAPNIGFCDYLNPYRFRRNHPRLSMAIIHIMSFPDQTAALEQPSPHLTPGLQENSELHSRGALLASSSTAGCACFAELAEIARRVQEQTAQKLRSQIGFT